MATDNTQKIRTQTDIAEELKLLWLEHMKKLLQEGSATSTDLATLARVLMANGWVLDPAKIPEGLREKLTTIPDFNNMPEDEYGV